MRRIVLYLVALLQLFLLASCSVKKNSAASRAYHSMTTRYNVYFNAREGFKKGVVAMESSFADDYSQLIPPHPVYKLGSEEGASVGGFDLTIEKCQKSIQLHSIRRAPQRGKYSSKAAREKAKIEEFNPFLHRAWMLMGQAQFYKTDFLGAATTFGYVLRHYRNLPLTLIEARLWAARSYLAMGWEYDAENLLTHLSGVKIPESLHYLHHLVYAELAYSHKNYKEAVALFEKVEAGEKSKIQRYRLPLLRGQLYAQLGDGYKAKQAYEKAIKRSPPYRVAFNAHILQSEVQAGGSARKQIKSLERMARNSKNSEWLDQLYMAIGNIHLAQGDTLRATRAYAQGVTESKQGGTTKALVALRLADLQFQRRRYALAQPYYAEAVSLLPRSHEAYKRVEFRAEVLNELIIPYNAVQLQDSLQHLASLSPAERTGAIERLIAEVERLEREEAERNQRDEIAAKREEANDGFDGFDGFAPQRPAVAPPQQMGGDKSWYFYNTQVVASGRTEFQKRWGNRKLEDDWRRRTKSNFVFESLDSNEEQVEADSEVEQQPVASTALVYSTNPKDVNYYLQQIPLTAEALAESDTLLMGALFQLGGVYKNRLEDYPLARQTFARIEQRWPTYNQMLDIWYERFLMAQRENSSLESSRYKELILAAYPESKQAKVLSDPDFIQNFLHAQEAASKLYAETFEAYSAGEMAKVRLNGQEASRRFALSKLIPNFRFLSAMASLSLGNREEFRMALRSLVDDYPEAELTQLAGSMLKGLAEGREMVGSGSLTAAHLWNRPLFADAEGLTLPGDSLHFQVDPLSPHRMLLLFNEEEVNRNLLLYEVARFNFRNFVVRDFDIEHQPLGDKFGLLDIRSFATFEELKRYEVRFFSDGGLGRTLPFGVKVILISDENFQILMRGKTISEYEQFYGEEFAAEPK